MAEEYLNNAETEVPEVPVSETASNFISAISKTYEKNFDREKEEFERYEQSARVYRKDSKRVIQNLVVYATLLLSIGVAAYNFFSLMTVFYYTDYTRLSSVTYPAVMFVLCVITLIYSSAWPYWNYYHRKKMFLWCMLFLLGIAFAEMMYAVISAVIVPLLLLPEPNQWITKGKWMFLIRMVTITPTLCATGFFVQNTALFVFDKMVIVQINGFRVLNHLDLRKDRKYQYDAVVVKRQSNGRPQPIREKDRYVHGIINGSTGGGKTSSVIIPMINGDLKKRCQNEDIQKKKIWKLLEEKKVVMNRPVTDRTFSMDAFTVVDKSAEVVVKEIRKRYRTCGITVIAPDDSLTDETYSLCESKGIPCNRVDPITDRLTDGEDKRGFIGFNPLYISPRIPEWQKTREIVKRATLFADVMQAINEIKGKGDPYFTSINRSVTVAFSICLCVTYPSINHRQPTPADVQYMVNNFPEIKPYSDRLKMMNDEYGDNRYGFVLDFINYDILGKGAEKMMEQARGLRMMMNEFLTNPLIRRTLCAPEDKTVDLDKMLEEGQITAVNYALELGETDSKGFGLFFLLSFIDAVFRRSGAEGADTIPHFLIIDELPVIIHSQFERAVSLFRKYKVAIIGCLQSLDQMEKNETTKFLKGVLMGGCAHHFLFGRCGIDEMRRYSELAGKEWVVTEAYSESETSITEEDPSLSYSTRESLQLQESLEGTQLRNRQFQEITMFTVVDGNLIPPFLGRVEFLDKTERNVLKRKKYEWKKFYERDLTEKPEAVKNNDIDEAEQQAAEQKTNTMTPKKGVDMSLYEPDFDDEEDEDDIVLFNADGTINSKAGGSRTEISNERDVVMIDKEDGSTDEYYEYLDEGVSAQNELREGFGMKPVGQGTSKDGSKIDDWSKKYEQSLRAAEVKKTSDDENRNNGMPSGNRSDISEYAVNDDGDVTL